MGAASEEGGVLPVGGRRWLVWPGGGGVLGLALVGNVGDVTVVVVGSVGHGLKWRKND